MLCNGVIFGDWNGINLLVSGAQNLGNFSHAKVKHRRDEVKPTTGRLNQHKNKLRKIKILVSVEMEFGSHL